MIPERFSSGSPNRRFMLRLRRADNARAVGSGVGRPVSRRGTLKMAIGEQSTWSIAELIFCSDQPTYRLSLTRVSGSIKLVRALMMEDERHGLWAVNDV